MLTSSTWWLAALSALAIALMHGLSIAHDSAGGGMTAAEMVGVHHAASMHETAGSHAVAGSHTGMQQGAVQQTVAATHGTIQVEVDSAKSMVISSAAGASCAAHNDCQVVARSEHGSGQLGDSGAGLPTLSPSPMNRGVSSPAGAIRARAPCLTALGISRT